MRTTTFYIVGVALLTLAVVFAVAAGIAWARLAKRRALRQRTAVPAGGRTPRPTPVTSRTDAHGRPDELEDTDQARWLSRP
jgi:hypothetical protein